VSACGNRLPEGDVPTPVSTPSHTEVSIAAVEEAIDGPASRSQTQTDKPTSLWAYPATYTLMGINLVVFGVMFRYGPVPQMIHQHAWSGVLTGAFDRDTLVRFGGTAADLIQQGQWWRLITGTFVHLTILHIVLNMWCLWNLGLFGEPLIGKRGLVTVYLLTGTAGMMLSYAWSILQRQDYAVVVGASGAVFGIAGILIVLLSNRKLNVPWKELRSLRRQVIFFAVANLAIGMTPQLILMASAEQLNRIHLDPASLPRIDNTAHLGGFLSGLALGLPLFPRMLSGRKSYRARQRWTFLLAGLILCLLGYAWYSFRAAAN
jgi:rhomboid protease GluP